MPPEGHEVAAYRSGVSSGRSRSPAPPADDASAASDGRGNPWRTTPPCTVEQCVDEPAPAAGRFARLLRHAALGTAIVATVPLLALPRVLIRPVVRRWARVAARVLGVRLDVLDRGTSPDGPGASGAADAHGDTGAHGRPRGPGRAGVLIVANHVSWLDIPLLLAYRPTMMVAKRELVPHPVANALATRLGAITIDRDRLMSLPAVVATVAAGLRAGAAVTVFPEAATWCGRAMGDFAPAFFEAALDAGVPVRPVALRYRLDGTEPGNAAGAAESGNATGAATTVPAFVGGIGAIGSLRRVLSTEGLVAEAIVLPEIDSTGLDRRTLARLSREAIAAALRRDGPAPPREPHRDTTGRVPAPRDPDPASAAVHATVPAPATAATGTNTDSSTGVAAPNGVSDAERAPGPRVPRRTDAAPPAR